MTARTVLIIVVIFELILIVCAFFKRKDKEMFKFLSFFAEIIAALSMTVTVFFPEQIATAIYPDINTYISENQSLNDENAVLTNTVVSLKDDCAELEAQYNSLKQEYKELSNRTFAEIVDAKLIVDGLGTSREMKRSVALVNGKEYFDGNVIYAITGNMPEYDVAQDMIFWGNQKQITKVPFSDISDILYNGKVYWKYGPADNNSFSVAGKEYSDGFVIGCDHSLFGDGDGYALFNLEEKYTEMSFDVGKTDSYEIQNVTLKIFLDGAFTEQYKLSGESSSTHITVSLNNANDLKMLLTDGSRVLYGFYNVVFATQ